jgi:hypothetical protein
MRAFTQTSPRDVALMVIFSCLKRGLDSVDLHYSGLREQKRGQSVNRTTLRSPHDPVDRLSRMREYQIPPSRYGSAIHRRILLGCDDNSDPNYLLLDRFAVRLRFELT